MLLTKPSSKYKQTNTSLKKDRPHNVSPILNENLKKNNRRKR